MPKTPTDPALDPPEDLTGDSGAYEVPEDLAATVADEGGAEPPRPQRSGALRIAIAVAVILAIGAGLLAYRAHHRRKVLREGLARADVLLRLDTAAGYREAASLLEPLAQLDPSEAASVRAFALAMLFADYRASDVEPEAEGLLVGPGRADVVPAYASLAMAALALGRGEAGTATTAVARAGDGARARALEARIAILAGNLSAALDPAAAAASEGAFPPGLAVHGDALRRLRRDPAAARAAYEAALAASPRQPRAVFGLAKLALGGDAPPDRAIAALERLVEDRDTPDVERGRAALHLAALRLRTGDRPGAGAALDLAGLDGPARGWAMRAAQVSADARGPYRAVSGAPAPLVSASDDDPGELSPEPPAPPAPPKVASKPPARKGASKATAKAATMKTAKTTATKKKSAAASKSTTARKTTATKKTAKRTTAR